MLTKCSSLFYQNCCYQCWDGGSSLLRNRYRHPGINEVVAVLCDANLAKKLQSVSKRPSIASSTSPGELMILVKVLMVSSGQCRAKRNLPCNMVA